MSDLTYVDAPPAPREAQPRRGVIHLIVVCVLLAGLGAFWYFGPSPIKKAVAWPAGVEVTKDFRLSSLAHSLGGRYELVLPQGDVVYSPHDMESLGIGSGFDKSRYPDRSSNWYVSRTYRDSRLVDQNLELIRGADPTLPYRAWLLDITYYTGALDTVPHIPEVCIAAGGQTIIASDVVTLPAIESLPAPWNAPLKVRRTLYIHKDDPDKTRPRVYVLYYLFSVNGEPEDDWRQVRLKLGYLWVTHCYFAKVQFGPRHPAGDRLEQTDREAHTFLKAALPEVLKQLPMPQDIARQKAAQGS
jgi:hypothetical protein